jgi:hypothetical protein
LAMLFPIDHVDALIVVLPPCDPLAIEHSEGRLSAGATPVGSLGPSAAHRLSTMRQGASTSSPAEWLTFKRSAAFQRLALVRPR